jgi:hypothetical protein
MSTVPSSSYDIRQFDRVLASTSRRVFPKVRDHYFDDSVITSLFLGKGLGDYAGREMSGRGMEEQSGGESVEIRMGLGEGQAGELAGPWGEHGVEPSDVDRNSRALWTHYWANATINDTEVLQNRGAYAQFSLIDRQLRLAMQTVVNRVGDHIYNNSGAPNRVTDLDSLVSANNVVQGLSGAIHPDFNSRGNDRTITDPSAIDFTATGAFATNGMQDMLSGYNNATNGMEKPNVVLSDYATHEKYENSLVAQQRYTRRLTGDSSFDNLAFKNVPYMPDDKCPADTQYFLNIGEGVKLICLAGANFEQKDWKPAHRQEARVAEIQAKIQLVVCNRKLVNKVIDIS